MGKELIAMISIHGDINAKVATILQKLIAEKKIPNAEKVSLVSHDEPSKGNRCLVSVHADEGKFITTFLLEMRAQGVLPEHVNILHVQATFEDVKKPARVLKPHEPGFNYPAVSWPKLST